MKNYFEETDYISNSQISSFVSYDKWGSRLLTPDIYKAYHIDKTMKFQITDAIVTWKIVDRYFDWEWEKVWEDYEIKSRRTSEDKLSWKVISPAMQESALTMIKWWETWDIFQEFIKDKDTKAQTVLKKEFELTDKSGEVLNIKIKWLPDFYNEKKKIIVDLKTSWNLNMIIDDLQFNWKPKFNARYLRQLANYNFMLWGWYDWVLALITEKWVKWIRVPNWILEHTWEQYELDLIDLTKFINDPKDINEDIFKSMEECLWENPELTL